MTDRHASDAGNWRKADAGPPRQTFEPSTRAPVISRSPRSERRNPAASQSSPIIVKPFQVEPAPRPLAEIFPRPLESSVPARAERSPVYQPQPQAQPQFPSPRREPVFPVGRSPTVEQPGSSLQTITPPVYRQEGRKFEPPAYTPTTPVPPAAPAPSLIPPRAAEPRFSPPAYQAPPRFSPPPVVAPRAIEAPVVRPSGPPPSYSPPPAPSSPPSQPRSEGARRSDGNRKPN